MARAAGTMRRLVHDRPAVVALLEAELGAIGFPHALNGQSNSTISTHSIGDPTARAAVQHEGGREWRVRLSIETKEHALTQLVEELADLYATVPRYAVRLHLEKSRARCWAGLGLSGFEEWGTEGEECEELTYVTDSWALEHGGHVCRKHYERYRRYLGKTTDANA